MNILVCGDSHTDVFKYNKTDKDFNFHICSVGGATAQGAVNPNSKTDSLRIFTGQIRNTKIKYDKILIMLGEVDCGFVIWVRSKRYNISVDEQLDNSIQNLFTFIKNIIETTNYQSSDIIVCGSILPTIKDSTDKKYLNGARSEVDVSQKIRTEKTLEYNDKLKKLSNELGYHYIEITKYIIGDDGLVNPEFRNKDPYNHHLDDAKAYHVWLNEIKQIISNEHKQK